MLHVPCFKGIVILLFFFSFLEASGPLERLFPSNQVLSRPVTCYEPDYDAHNIKTQLFSFIGKVFFFFSEALAGAFQGSSKNLGQAGLPIISVPLCLCPVIL